MVISHCASISRPAAAGCICNARRAERNSPELPQGYKTIRHPENHASRKTRTPMNAIVLIALKRPYTFVVLAILILIFGGRAAVSTQTDIFPNIGIPVV